MERFSAGRGLAVAEWISEIGGGMNFRRRKFLRLLDQVIAGEVSMLVVVHKDRLARFGFELIDGLASMAARLSWPVRSRCHRSRNSWRICWRSWMCSRADSMGYAATKSSSRPRVRDCQWPAIGYSRDDIDSRDGGTPAAGVRPAECR
jgi:hypothetical protein